MSDVYIKNRHGVVHSIPEWMLDQALAQGAEKITKATYTKAMKQQAEAEDTDNDESTG